MKGLETKRRKKKKKERRKKEKRKRKRMTTEGQQFLEKWNKMFDAVHKNPERKGEVAGLLDEMVAEEVVMGAPPYRKPLTGFFCLLLLFCYSFSSFFFCSSFLLFFFSFFFLLFLPLFL